jgi:hypothetical protein
MGRELVSSFIGNAFVEAEVEDLVDVSDSGHHF